MTDKKEAEGCVFQTLLPFISSQIEDQEVGCVLAECAGYLAEVVQTVPAEVNILQLQKPLHG